MVNQFRCGANKPKLLISGDQIHFLSHGFDNPRTLTIDSTHHPAWIDIVLKNTINPAAPSKVFDQAELGIYSIISDDLKICSTSPGGERPTDFTTQPGDSRTVIILKRAKGPGALPAGPALRMADMENLRSIGNALVEYADRHHHFCPRDFGALGFGWSPQG